jgi:hypothetical protein
MTMGADPLACAAIGAEAGDGLVAFFVRKEKKQHGLQRWIEGPELTMGTRCLVVEDVVRDRADQGGGPRGGRGYRGRGSPRRGF